jgi:hypothetical protein
MRDPLTLVRDRYLAADSKFGFALRRRRTALKRQVAAILGNPAGIDRQMLAYEYLCGNGIEIGALHASRHPNAQMLDQTGPLPP